MLYLLYIGYIRPKQIHIILAYYDNAILTDLFY